MFTGENLGVESPNKRDDFEPGGRLNEEHSTSPPPDKYINFYV